MCAQASRPVADQARGRTRRRVAAGVIEVQVRVDDPANLLDRVAGLAQTFVDQGVSWASDLERCPHRAEVRRRVGPATRLVHARVEDQDTVAGIDREAHHRDVAHDTSGLSLEQTADIGVLVPHRSA